MKAGDAECVREALYVARSFLRESLGGTPSGRESLDLLERAIEIMTEDYRRRIRRRGPP